MGRARRALCVATPYALSTVSLICLIFVGIGCTQTSMPESGLYLMRINLTEFGPALENVLGDSIARRSLSDSSLNTISDTASSIGNTVHDIGNTSPNTGSDAVETTTGAIEGVVSNAGTLAHSVSDDLAKVKSNISNFYMVGLWGYCKGTINETGSDVTDCTPPNSSFWFNFTESLGLDNSWIEKIFPGQVEKAMDVYKSASRGIIATYTIAVIATVMTLGMGVIVLLSGWGSLIVSIFAMISTISSIAGSATVTGVYGSLVGVLQSVFRSSGVQASLGRPAIAMEWVASAFSTAACIFWLLGICCC